MERNDIITQVEDLFNHSDRIIHAIFIQLIELEQEHNGEEITK